MAVLSTNRSEYFEVYYACAIAGFIAQPINWRLAAEEISRIIDDGTPKVLVCEDQFLNVRDEIKTKSLHRSIASRSVLILMDPMRLFWIARQTRSSLRGRRS